ncbi:thermonuclease family protein [Thermoproteota archaeon]
MARRYNLFLILLLAFSSRIIPVLAFEIDKTAYVTTIYDGDTFEISTGEVIRLADVDCPERYDTDTLKLQIICRV